VGVIWGILGMEGKEEEPVGVVEEIVEVVEGVDVEIQLR